MERRAGNITYKIFKGPCLWHFDWIYFSFSCLVAMYVLNQENKSNLLYSFCVEVEIALLQQLLHEYNKKLSISIK